MLENLKNYNQWVASKFGTSPVLALLIVINFVATGFLVSTGSNSVNGISIHIIDLSWSLFMATYLCLFHLSYWRSLNRTVLQNIRAWFSSAILTNVSQFVFVTAVSGQTPPTEYTNQLINGLFTLVASCLVFTIGLAGVAEGRALMLSLRIAKNELVILRLQALERIESFAQQIQSPISEMVTELENRTIPKIAVGREVKLVINELNSFLTENLKPFMGELAVLNPSFEAVSAQSNKAKLPKELSKISVRDSLNIPANAAILGLYFVPSSFFLSGLGGALATCLGITFATIVAYLNSRNRGHQRFTWWSLAASNSVFVTFSLLVVTIPLGQPFDVAFPTSIASGLLTFAASGLQSAIVRRATLNSEMKKLNDELRESNQDLNRRLQHLREQVASHAHNTLQAQILKLKLQLSGERLFQESSRIFTLAAIARIKAFGYSKPRNQPAFKEQLDELIGFWDGAVKVSIDVGASASVLLESDPALAAAVLKVLGESITNAAKYSSDGCVFVTLSSIREKTIEFTAKNSFRQTLKEFTPGLGSHILNEATTQWKRSFEGSTFCLEATFVCN